MKNIYVIESNNGLVKVGVSSSTSKRFKELQTQGGITIVNEYFTEPSKYHKYIELLAHHNLSDKKEKGEWFNVKFEDAVNVVKSVFIENGKVESISYPFGNVDYFSDISLGNLTQLWSLGNKQAEAQTNMSMFLNSTKTLKYIKELESMGFKDNIVVAGGGNTKVTLASSHIMTFAAKHISPAFHFQVIDDFIKFKVNEFKSEGVESVKSLTLMVKDNLNLNRDELIQVAKMIKKKVNPQLLSWNFATADELRFRLEIENDLHTSLRLGLVKNYEHLKELIGKI